MSKRGSPRAERLPPAAGADSRCCWCRSCCGCCRCRCCSPAACLEVTRCRAATRGEARNDGLGGRQGAAGCCCCGCWSWCGCCCSCCGSSSSTRKNNFVRSARHARPLLWEWEWLLRERRSHCMRPGPFLGLLLGLLGCGNNKTTLTRDQTQWFNPQITQH